MEKDFVSFDREKQEISVRFDDGRNLKIGKNDVDVSFFSGGPGGQNVNKNINGVQLIYRIPDGYRRESQKTRQLISRSIAERSQPRNLAQAFIQLTHKVRDYFYIPPIRRKSHTPRKAKEKRLDDKKYQSYKKESRRKMDY